MGASPRAPWHPREWPGYLLLALLWTLAHLPGRIVWLLAAVFGALAYALAARPRRIALTNVALCFPALQAPARRALVRAHFRFVAESTLSLGLAFCASRARLCRRVRVVGAEHYAAARTRGNVILFAPHFVGLDIGGMRLSAERPLVSMYREPKTRILEVLLRKRQRFGAILVERAANLRALIRIIRSGVPFYYLPDQDPGGAEAVFVPFFGVPAATVVALSRIARMTDAAVLPCVTRVLPRGAGFEVTISPPLKDFPSDDDIADARRMNATIEAAVQTMPAQYLWLYKRFKTRPPGVAAVYR